MKKILVAPSVLTADFCNMGAEVRRLEDAGADMIHLDVMDGAFVPNISFGPKMVSDVRAVTGLPLDAHLMVDRPERYVDRFVAAGADYVTVHYEATADPLGCLKKIRELGAKCGIVINPATPPEKVEDLIPACDMVLVMSVQPGFGGQKFMPSALGKLRYLSERIDRLGADVLLEVDGGVGPANAAQVREAGATVIVAGSAIVNAPDAAAAVKAIRGL